MKKHNVDVSLMEISEEDKTWGYQTVFSNESLKFKDQLDAHYLQYFPPQEKKLTEKIAAINFLDLKRQENQNILDISTGCGHFIALCQKLGHTCQGTEIPESLVLLDPLYKHYKLDVAPLIISKQIEISLSKQYNLITMLRTVFDEGWSREDWIFFKDNLFDYLLPTGKVFIKTNIKAIPSMYNDASTILGEPIKGWNSLTYLLKK